MSSNRTHGESRFGTVTPEYRAWQEIKTRCSEQSKYFRNYAGRGITMHPAWRTDFQSFLAHVGRRPSPLHSIDRIDNDGNYEPGNVRWATTKEQHRNKRTNRKVEFRGQVKTLAEWSEILGVQYATIRHRVNVGWPIEAALTKPSLRGDRCVVEFNGKRQTMQAWAKETGFSTALLWRRLRKGWGVNRALTEPRRICLPDVGREYDRIEREQGGRL